MWVDTLQAFESMCVLQLLGGQCPVTGVVLEEFICLYFTFYQLLKEKQNPRLKLWTCLSLENLYGYTHRYEISSVSENDSIIITIIITVLYVSVWPYACEYSAHEGQKRALDSPWNYVCVWGGYVDLCLCRNMHMWVQEPWKLVESFGASWVGVAQAVVSNTIGENWAQEPQRSNEYS